MRGRESPNRDRELTPSLQWSWFDSAADVILREQPGADCRGMTERPTSPQPGAPDTVAEVDPDVAQLLGLRPADAEPIQSADELDTMGEMTDTRIYEGELEARPPDSDQPDESQAANLESLVATELRDGETDEPGEAAEEGLTWVPPTDPPIRTDARGDAEVAAGFGTTAQDEPFDADHHGSALSAVDEVESRVLEALRADAATTDLADGVSVDAEGSRVVLRGTVPDIEDEDNVVAVVEDVTGVAEVVSRIEVAALDTAGEHDIRD